jgi:PAS domain S-box-containing protein
LEEAGKVLQTLEPAEQEVPGRDGQYYLLRLVPYTASDGSVPGVVITMADISEFRKVHHSLVRLTDELHLRGVALERTEQCWQILVNNIPDSIVRYDRNLNITFVNEGFSRETGVDPSQIMGRSAFEISSDLQRDDSWPQSLRQVLNTGSVKEYTTTYVTNRGEQHYHAIMVPELSADGQEVESVLTISRNITSIKQYERQLQQSESLWRGLVDNTPDIISRYDRSLRLVFVNRAAEKEFGVPTDELLGRNPFGFSFRTKNRQAFVDKLEAAFATGQMQQHISETNEGGEERKYFLSTIVPEWREGASPETVLLISRNITDIKRTENELRETGALIRQQNGQLVKANEYLDNFVYAVAHDLRSPVANLTLLSRLLLKLDSGGKVQEYADFIHATVQRLDQTLNGLVEVLEVQSSFRVKLQEVIFEQVLHEVTAEMEPLLETTSGRIEGDFTGCAGILYIPAYIASIFRNLISNSLKYSAEGRPPVVSVTASRQADEVILEFRDNGMGIDLDRQGHKLFRPFSRLTTQAEGKGIGLHLIRSMIEKNGGRIEAESDVGSGTIFRCWLKEYNGQEINMDELQGQKPREKSDTTQAASAD